MSRLASSLRVRAHARARTRVSAAPASPPRASSPRPDVVDTTKVPPSLAACFTASGERRGSVSRHANHPAQLGVDSKSTRRCAAAQRPSPGRACTHRHRRYDGVGGWAQPPLQAQVSQRCAVSLHRTSNAPRLVPGTGCGRLSLPLPGCVPRCRRARQQRGRETAASSRELVMILSRGSASLPRCVRARLTGRRPAHQRAPADGAAGDSPPRRPRRFTPDALDGFMTRASDGLYACHQPNASPLLAATHSNRRGPCSTPPACAARARLRSCSPASQRVCAQHTHSISTARH